MAPKIYAALFAIALGIPVVASAQQSNAGLTRAQVRAEQVQLERAGYNPVRRDPYYPADIQAATARLQGTDSVAQLAATSGYGGATDGFSQSGANTTARQVQRSIYFGH
jgi:hypothetical protein